MDKKLIVLCSTIFLYSISVTLPYPLIGVLFLSEYELLTGQWVLFERMMILGVTLSLFPFAAFLSAPIAGSLADNYGKKRMILINLIIAIIAYIALGSAVLFSSLALFMASFFISGLAASNSSLAMSIVTNYADAKSKYKKISIISGCAYMGSIFGFLLSGFMANKNFSDLLGLSIPFYTTAFLLCVAFAICYFLLTKTPNINVNKVGFLANFNLWYKVKTIHWNMPFLLKLLFINMLYLIAVYTFYTFVSSFLSISWQMLPTQISLYMALALLIVAGNDLFVNYNIQQKYPNKVPAIIFVSMFALGILFFLLIKVTWVWQLTLIFILIGFFISFSVTLIFFDISDQSKDKPHIQGEVMGLTDSSRRIGGAISALIGPLAVLLEADLMFVSAAIIAILSSFVYLIIYRTKKI